MINIHSLHNGPRHSAHGGVAAGRMAELVDADRAAVRFHAPPPLDEPLTGVALPLGVVDVLAGSRRIATVRPSAQLTIEPFEQLDPMAVAIAESNWLDHHDGHHPFPTCFGCGNERSDGLDLAPGTVPGTSVHATFWTPLVDGSVPPWLVWAALDCPSGGPALAAVPAGTAVMTGELAVDIREPLDGSASYQILSRCHDRSARKFKTQAAIVDQHGHNVAVAEATWIALAPEIAAAS